MGTSITKSFEAGYSPVQHVKLTLEISDRVYNTVTVNYKYHASIGASSFDFYGHHRWNTVHLYSTSPGTTGETSFRYYALGQGPSSVTKTGSFKVSGLSNSAASVSIGAYATRDGNYGPDGYTTGKYGKREIGSVECEPNKSYTIKFNANGGYESTCPSDRTIYYSPSAHNISIPSTKPRYANGYYDFAGGWSTSYGLNNSINYYSSRDYLINKNDTLYAVWKPHQYNYQFWVDGKKISSKTHKYGISTVLEKEPVKPGHTFGLVNSDTWRTSPNGHNGWLCDANDLRYKASHSVNVNKANTSPGSTTNINFVAKWTKNNYRIIFNPNGGSISEPSKDVLYNDPIGNLPVPERPGYQFLGWSRVPMLNRTDQERLYSDSNSNLICSYDYKSKQTSVYSDVLMPDPLLQETKNIWTVDNNNDIVLYAYWDYLTTFYVYTEGEALNTGRWNLAIPYVYADDKWQMMVGYCNVENQWKL